jgi:hypothetical protein
MPRRTYKLELIVTMALDDERLADVEDRVTGRVNEMLVVLERQDDVRIGLVHVCHVTVEGKAS